MQGCRVAAVQRREEVAEYYGPLSTLLQLTK